MQNNTSSVQYKKLDINYSAGLIPTLEKITAEEIGDDLAKFRNIIDAISKLQISKTSKEEIFNIMRAVKNIAVNIHPAIPEDTKPLAHEIHSCIQILFNNKLVDGQNTEALTNINQVIDKLAELKDQNSNDEIANIMRAVKKIAVNIQKITLNITKVVDIDTEILSAIHSCKNHVIEIYNYGGSQPIAALEYISNNADALKSINKVIGILAKLKDQNSNDGKMADIINSVKKIAVNIQKIGGIDTNILSAIISYKKICELHEHNFSDFSIQNWKEYLWSILNIIRIIALKSVALFKLNKEIKNIQDITAIQDISDIQQGIAGIQQEIEEIQKGIEKLANTKLEMNQETTAFITNHLHIINPIVANLAGINTIKSALEVVRFQSSIIKFSNTEKAQEDELEKLENIKTEEAEKLNNIIKLSKTPQAALEYILNFTDKENELIKKYNELQSIHLEDKGDNKTKIKNILTKHKHYLSALKSNCLKKLNNNHIAAYMMKNYPILLTIQGNIKKIMNDKFIDNFKADMINLLEENIKTIDEKIKILHLNNKDEEIKNNTAANIQNKDAENNKFQNMINSCDIKSHQPTLQRQV